MYSRVNGKKMLRLINFCKLARLYLLFNIQGVAHDFYFVRKKWKNDKVFEISLVFNALQIFI